MAWVLYERHQSLSQKHFHAWYHVKSGFSEMLDTSVLDVVSVWIFDTYTVLLRSWDSFIVPPLARGDRPQVLCTLPDFLSLDIHKAG